MKFCDVCSRSLSVSFSAGPPYTVIAVSISVINDKDVAAQVLAPYEPREYNICYPCYLKSLGISSEKPEV